VTKIFISKSALQEDHYHDRRRCGRRAHSYAVADVLLPPDGPLIKEGYIYIAQPPLYKVKKDKKEMYLDTTEALDQWLLTEGTRRDRAVHR